jgi:hypothetical protein
MPGSSPGMACFLAVIAGLDPVICLMQIVSDNRFPFPFNR